MKTFDNVASLKLARLNANQFVETGGFTEKGGTGAKRYFTKTASQAAADGDVVDDVHTNFVLANGIVAIDTSKPVIEHYTLAEAKELAGAVVGQIIQITDRGNGQFEAVSSTTNVPDELGVIQGQGSIAWKVIIDGEASVEWFGAEAGVISDSSIQAAIDYLVSGVVTIPDKPFYIFGSIQIPLESKALTIRGAGATSYADLVYNTTNAKGGGLFKTSGNSPIFAGDGGVLYAQRSIKIENLNLYSNQDAWIVDFNGMPENTGLQNCCVVGYNGVKFDNMWSNCYIKDSVVGYANDNFTSSGTGIQYTNSILGGGLNKIENTSVYKFAVGIWGGSSSEGGGVTSTIRIENSQSLGCTYGVVNNGADFMYISGCHMEAKQLGDGGIAAVQVRGSVTGLSISSTYFQGVGQTDGILIDNGSGEVVAGVSIRGCSFGTILTGGNAIHIKDAGNVHGAVSDCAFSSEFDGAFFDGVALRCDTGNSNKLSLLNNYYDNSTLIPFFSSSGEQPLITMQDGYINYGSRAVLSGDVGFGTVGYTSTIGKESYIINMFSSVAGQNINSLHLGRPGGGAFSVGSILKLRMDTAGLIFLHSTVTQGGFITKSGTGYATVEDNEVVDIILTEDNAVKSWMII